MLTGNFRKWCQQETTGPGSCKPRVIVGSSNWLVIHKTRSSFSDCMARKQAPRFTAVLEPRDDISKKVQIGNIRMTIALATSAFQEKARLRALDCPRGEFLNVAAAASVDFDWLDGFVSLRDLPAASSLQHSRPRTLCFPRS